MIQEQVTWLAGSFLLTGHEIENLNANLARVIDQNALEIIFAAGIQQRAATNMLIKPLVVSIIRQRPVMEYDASHLGNMVNRLEETLPRSYRHNGYSAPFTFYHLICQCHRHDSEVNTMIHLFKTCMITAFILGLTWSAPLGHRINVTSVYAIQIRYVREIFVLTSSGWIMAETMKDLAPHHHSATQRQIWSDAGDQKNGNGSLW